MKKNMFCLAALALGCGGEVAPETDGVDEILGVAEKSDDYRGFIHWRDRLAKEPGAGGAYIVDVDRAIVGQKRLKRYYQQRVSSKKRDASGIVSRQDPLIVSQSSAVDTTWGDAQKKELRYCVSDDFGNDKSLVVDAMQDAAAEWGRAADVAFIYLSSEDDSCDAVNERVVFDVRPTTGANYYARAFFPDSPRVERSVLIDSRSFYPEPPLTLDGILRHELGHTLGFRHEHTRPEARAPDCFEDSHWRALTPYDQGSVMHHSQCNGIDDSSFQLTDADRRGAAALYGAPRGEPTPPTSEPTRGGVLTKKSFAGDVAAGTEIRFGSLHVVPGTALHARMTGSGDADLYLRWEAPPTTRRYDCAPLLDTTKEDCLVTVPLNARKVHFLARVSARAIPSRLRVVVTYYAPSEGGVNNPPVSPQPPSQPSRDPATVRQVAAGGSHTCALLSTGRVRCWGDGYAGQLGHGKTTGSTTSGGDIDVGGSAVQIVAGQNHTCVLLSTGKVRCWGKNDHGQLGYGNTANIGDDESPASAGDVDVGGNVVQIAAGESHTCALLSTGKVRCWGARGQAAGQLGYGNTNGVGDDESPASAGDVDVGGGVVQIAASGVHTCALLSAGKVRCWGYGAGGQLGYGNMNNVGDNESPAGAGDVNIGGDVVQVAAGRSHTCAILSTGRVRCWGRGASGQLGYGNTNDVGDDESPASAGDLDVGGDVVQIAAGESHTCALLSMGSVRCWGRGVLWGQLGYADFRRDWVGDDETPASAGDVNVGGIVVHIAAGRNHTCAVLSTGAVRCWGRGDDGQLGYGSMSNIGDDETPASAGDVPLHW